MEKNVKNPNVPGMLKSIHWRFLKSKAIPFDSIAVNRFYLLALKDDKDDVQVVDVKVRSIHIESDPHRTIIKVHDGKSVESITSLGYKKDWVICEANMEVARTSDNILKVDKALRGITKEEMEDIVKKLGMGNSGPGLGGNGPGIGPTWPHQPSYPGLVGPGYPGPYPTIDPNNPFGPKIGSGQITKTWTSTSGFLLGQGNSGGSFSSNSILVSNTILTCDTLNTNLEDAPILFGDLVKQI